MNETHGNAVGNGGKLAIILFNLGGPDGPDAVQPFLKNLFSDPAIITLPSILRLPLARLISSRRAPVAREIYEHLGGGSPLLPNTQAQARALENALIGKGFNEVRAFPCMRYWHPMSDRVAREVADYAPDRIVLLPLYPQFSTTTTESSLIDWHRAAKKAGLKVPSTTVCCYPEEPGFAAAMAQAIAPVLDEAASYGTPRLLFSAHGLPRKIVDGGDPYQWQVERSAQQILEVLAAGGKTGLDALVSYQSRVGPMEWIKPYTEAEIRRAGEDRVPVVIAPVAFVSEHSETLVELDIEYRKLAEECGVPFYGRVPTVGTAVPFIAGLADAVAASLSRKGDAPAPPGGARLCPASFGRCICRQG